MKRFLTTPFTTLRPPPKSGGKQGAPVPYLVDATLRCTPPDPAVDEVTTRTLVEQLGRDVRLLQCFVTDLDVAEGDVLIARGMAYPVRRSDRWDWRGTLYRRLIVEDTGTAAPVFVGLDLGTDAGVALALGVSVL